MAVGPRRFAPPPYATQEIGPRRREEVIVRQLSSRLDLINEAQAVLGTVGHGDSHRPVECDHGRWMNMEQQVVELRDLPPVRIFGPLRPGVQTRNRSL